MRAPKPSAEARIPILISDKIKRPLLFTEDSKEADSFFLTHKLMPKLDTITEWVECEDGGYIRK